MGFAVAQCVHACDESSPGWLPSGTYAVVLEVPNETELLRVAEALRKRNVSFRLIQESDPPHSGQYTAIGIAPTYNRDVLKPILKKLKLYGGVA